MKNSLFSCAEPCFQLRKSFLAPNCHLCNSRFSRRLFFSSKPGPQSADLGSVNKNRKGLDAENKLTEDLQLGDFCPFSFSFDSTVQYFHLIFSVGTATGPRGENVDIIGNFPLIFYLYWVHLPLHFFRNYKIFENTFEIWQNFRKFSKKRSISKLFSKIL